MRVVVADDDATVARSVARWLQSWGYEPIVVYDGMSAWREMKRADSPRLCILDWDMPHLTGMDLARMIRATPHGAGVYVLMLTARKEKCDLIDALESGADDFLSKPFHPRELQLRLARGVRDVGAASTPRDVGGAHAHAGTVLGGKVRLEREVGRGGMGTVWLGVHLALGINVAVKFMDSALAEHADFATFDREARAAARLRGEHIVRVYDHGIAADGIPYLVMEFLEGESLAARMEQRGPLDAATATAVVSDIARALTEAEGHGVVHGDVKPGNILLLDAPDRPSGVTAKLIDFGLARPAETSNAPESVAGTPWYMSPESLRGLPGSRAMLDVWALAVTTFEALTGALPFDGETPSEIYERIVKHPHPRPTSVRADLPEALDTWFARACCLTASGRYATAEELAVALAAATTPGRRAPLAELSGPPR